MKRIFLIITVVILLIPASSFAHGGHGTGFMAGLTHPIFGLDHLLAILVIAIYSYMQGSAKSFWQLSTVFLGLMIVGAFFGLGKSVYPFSEKVIVSSILLMGLAVAIPMKLPKIISILIIGFFGFIHGQAHGVEMPDKSNVWLYFLGFVLAVGMASAVGLLFSKIMTKGKFSVDIIPLRLAGAFISGMGLILLLS